MSDSRFFAFNPRSARVLLLLAAVASALVTFTAVREIGGQAPLAAARAGVGAGLLLAFVFVRHRLRPREGWGVLLTPLTLVASRPLSGGSTEVVWTRVRAVGRAGKRKDTLVFVMDGDERLLLPRHLFAGQTFDELARAVEERAPAPPFDA